MGGSAAPLGGEDLADLRVASAPLPRPPFATEPGGYRLCLDGDDCDVVAFERRIADGRLELARGRRADAVRLLGDALARWRARPFTEFADHEALDVGGNTPRRAPPRGVEDWIEARLDTGEIRGVADELEALVAADPFRERLWALLIRSLYLGGRQADALGAYRRARSLLLEELGIEPGPELRAAETAVLRQDVSLGSNAGRAAGVPTRYALTRDGIEIAYRAIGDGDVVVVFVLEWTMNVELIAELDALRPFLDRLASLGRLVIVQRRDTGISGRDDRGGFATPEGCVLDLDAVLDDVGAERAAVVGWGHGGQVALAFAAARPERVSHVAAITSYPRLTATTRPPAWSRARLPRLLPRRDGGQVGDREAALPDLRSGRRIRPGAHHAGHPDGTADADAGAGGRDAAPRVDVRRPFVVTRRALPRLVVGLRESISGAANARALADLLPSATYIELPGYFVPTAAEADAIADAVTGFLGDGAS